MTQVVLFLALPIGILFYYFDRKLRRKNRAITEAFIDEVIRSDRNNHEKIEHLARMFTLNQYRIESRTETTLVVTHKHLNIGAAIIAFAVLPE